MNVIIGNQILIDSLVDCFMLNHGVGEIFQTAMHNMIEVM